MDKGLMKYDIANHEVLARTNKFYKDCARFYLREKTILKLEN